MHVLDREHGRRLLPLIIITVRLKIVQDRVRVAFCLGLRLLFKVFRNFACPSLNDAVARLSDITCDPLCGFKKVFARFFVAVYDSVTITWVTFSTSVPVAAVILKHGLCLRVVSVNRCALYPTLASMPGHCVVNADFPALGFLLKPPKRFFGSLMTWVKCFLKSCLRRFDLFAWAIDYRFPLGTPLGMALKVVSSCKSRVSMYACISFRQLCNVFY